MQINKENTCKYYMPILCFITLLVNLLINTYYSSNPILDIHAFRQTQTAITAYYLDLNGFSFAYQTPVLGYPWSIPFEFPIFQSLVSIFSKLFNFPLTQTGKIISLIFFILTTVPISFTLKRLGVCLNVTYFALALYLSTPLYLFWSGTFMIETAALLFTLSFLYYAIKLIQSEFVNENYLWMTFFLLLACLQKITTVLPLIPFVVALAIYFNFTKFCKDPRVFIRFFLALVIPVMITFVWIKYSDSVKSENLIASTKLISSKLTDWNYGTLDQRLSKELWWDCVLVRNIFTSSFIFLGPFCIFFALLLVKNSRDKLILLALLFLFIAPFLIFTNLHIVHNYYQTANLIYYIIAVALSVSIVCCRFSCNHRFLIIVASCFVLSNYFFFYKIYYVAKSAEINISNNRTLKLSDFIKNKTLKEKPILVFGYDWSSEIAFYSERKALMIPDWGGFGEKAITDSSSFLGGDSPSAIVLCSTQNQIVIKKLILANYPNFTPEIVGGCEVFLPNKKSG